MYNRKIAIPIMIIMIILGTFLGGYRSLNSLYKKVDKVFYQGVDGDGIGIASDLNDRINTSINLISIAKGYDQDVRVEAAITAVNSAKDALSSAATIGDKYQANIALTEATEELHKALGNESLQLSEKDAGYRDSLYNQLSSRNDTISHDGYNDSAVEYNNALQEFPASFFTSLFGIEKAVLFR